MLRVPEKSPAIHREVIWNPKEGKKAKHEYVNMSLEIVSEL